MCCAGSICARCYSTEGSGNGYTGRMTATERTARLPWAGPAVERRRDSENAADVVPRGLRVAAALGWRLLVVAAALWVLGQVIAYLSGIFIPVAVALLLAALLSPAVQQLRRWHVPGGLATAVVLVGGLVALAVLLTFVVRTVIGGLPQLGASLTQSIAELTGWLANGPLHISSDQLGAAQQQLFKTLQENQANITAATLTTAATVGELLDRVPARRVHADLLPARRRRDLAVPPWRGTGTRPNQGRRGRPPRARRARALRARDGHRRRRRRRRDRGCPGDPPGPAGDAAGHAGVPRRVHPDHRRGGGRRGRGARRARRAGPDHLPDRAGGDHRRDAAGEPRAAAAPARPCGGAAPAGRGARDRYRPVRLGDRGRAARRAAAGGAQRGYPVVEQPGGCPGRPRARGRGRLEDSAPADMPQSELE